MEKLKPLDFVSPNFNIEKLIQDRLRGMVMIGSGVVQFHKDLSVLDQDPIRKSIERELNLQTAAIGIITETDGLTASVSWIGESYGLHNAWWDAKDLNVIDNLPRILSNNLAHPFGKNEKQGDLYFPVVG